MPFCMKIDIRMQHALRKVTTSATTSIDPQNLILIMCLLVGPSVLEACVIIGLFWTTFSTIGCSLLGRICLIFWPQKNDWFVHDFIVGFDDLHWVVLRFVELCLAIDLWVTLICVAFRWFVCCILLPPWRVAIDFNVSWIQDLLTNSRQATFVFILATCNTEYAHIQRFELFY